MAPAVSSRSFKTIRLVSESDIEPVNDAETGHCGICGGCAAAHFSQWSYSEAGENMGETHGTALVWVKTVRWGPEDCFSSVAAVACLVEQVQWRVWTQWKKAQTSSAPVSTTCVPICELRAAMVEAYLVPYFALEADDGDLRIGESGEEEGCYEMSPSPFLHHHHRWFLQPCSFSLDATLRCFVRRHETNAALMNSDDGLISSFVWLRRMTIHLVSALETLHCVCGVCHGDINLGNVLVLMPDGQDIPLESPTCESTLLADSSVRFLLGDLESAFVSERKGAPDVDGKEVPQLAMPGAGACRPSCFSGTLLYASLEDLVGPHVAGLPCLGEDAFHLGEQNDVWSLGAVILHVLQLLLFYHRRHGKAERDVAHTPQGVAHEVETALNRHPFSEYWIATDTQTESATSVFEVIDRLTAFKKRALRCSAFQEGSTAAVEEEVYAGTRQTLLRLLSSCEDDTNVPMDCIDLLSRALHPDPSRRASITGLRQMRWCQVE